MSPEERAKHNRQVDELLGNLLAETSRLSAISATPSWVQLLLGSFGTLAFLLLARYLL